MSVEFSGIDQKKKKKILDLLLKSYTTYVQ